MQVRQVIAAALLAATAVGTMAQELDASETLQARNLAAQKAVAEREAQAQAQVTRPATQNQTVTGLTRAQVKAELIQWQRAHKEEVGDRG